MSDADFNDACTDFVHSIASRIPSLLERLIFLASVRDLVTGEHIDHVIETLRALKFGKAERDEQVTPVQWGTAELDHAVRHEHLAAFEDWLCLSLQQQMAELEGHASSQGIPSPTLFRTWIHEKPYERLVPCCAMPAQRHLFLTDLEAALATLSA